MAAYDISERIRSWVAAAIAQTCMGQEFGYDVRFDAGSVPGVPGTVVNYTVVITLRHPLLGQPPFAGTFTVPVERLGDEQLVRSTAQQAVLQLGKLHKDTLDAVKHGGPAKLQVPPPSQTARN